MMKEFCWPHSDDTVMCHDTVSWPVMWHCVTCVRWWSHDHQEGPTANRKPVFMLEKILTTPAQPEQQRSVHWTVHTGHYTPNTFDGVNYGLGVNFHLWLSSKDLYQALINVVHNNVANNQSQIFHCTSKTVTDDCSGNNGWVTIRKWTLGPGYVNNSQVIETLPRVSVTGGRH